MKNVFYNEGISLYVSKVLPNIFISSLIVCIYVLLVVKQPIVVVIASLLPLFIILFLLGLIFETRAVRALNTQYNYTNVRVTKKLVFIAQVNLMVANFIISVLFAIPIIGTLLSISMLILGPIVFEQFYLSVIKKGKFSFRTANVLPAVQMHISFCLKLALFTVVFILAAFGMIALVIINPIFIVLIVICAFLFQSYQTGIMYSYFMNNETKNEDEKYLNNEEY